MKLVYKTLSKTSRRHHAEYCEQEAVKLCQENFAIDDALKRDNNTIFGQCLSEIFSKRAPKDFL